jgi:FkbM family methyltransferase
MLKEIGQKLSRIGDVIQEPRLLNLRFRGVEVRTFECLNKSWLRNSGVRTIFDIGANTGQFARAIHEVLPEAFIYSFEPLSDCYKEMQRAMGNVEKFRGFNTALGEKDGEAVFYRSEWSPSSSLLPMGVLHRNNFPHTARESRETVGVRRLDDYVDGLTIEDNVLLKLDVQGYEDKVLAGGKYLLERAKILIVETAMVPLYDGQPLFRDIFTTLDNHGFRYKGALSQSPSPIDGSILYSDSIFVRDA